MHSSNLFCNSVEEFGCAETHASDMFDLIKSFFLRYLSFFPCAPVVYVCVCLCMFVCFVCVLYDFDVNLYVNLYVNGILGNVNLCFWVSMQHRPKP
jgi:hypothetical protein